MSKVWQISFSKGSCVSVYPRPHTLHKCNTDTLLMRGGFYVPSPWIWANQYKNYFHQDNVAKVRQCDWRLSHKSFYGFCLFFSFGIYDKGTRSCHVVKPPQRQRIFNCSRPCFLSVSPGTRHSRSQTLGSTSQPWFHTKIWQEWGFMRKII